jgi:2,4-dienoyl-CoA reductase-like NADH-dependent reductase (Old Yellow Enzyme family)
MFREIFGETPFVSTGGFNDTNCWGVIEEGSYDALAIGRYFLTTPDLVERLKHGKPLNKYDRSRFYGPFEDKEVAYTGYTPWEKSEKAKFSLCRKYLRLEDEKLPA